jgi:methyl coenzyme M reductase beta subunit
VNDQKMVFPLKVKLVSETGAVGEVIEETIQDLVNDKLIEGKKQFKRCK